MPNRTLRRTAAISLVAALILTGLPGCASDTVPVAPSDPQFAAPRDAIALKIQDEVNKIDGVAGSHVLDTHQAAGKDTVSVFLLVKAADVATTTSVVSEALAVTWRTVDHTPAGVNVQVYDTKTKSNLDVPSAMRALNLASKDGSQSSATVEATTLTRKYGKVANAATVIPAP